MENAPGKVISTPETATPAAVSNSNPQLSEIVKLVQAGVGEPVLMLMSRIHGGIQCFFGRHHYLNDLGVAETVVTAMIQQTSGSNRCDA